MTGTNFYLKMEAVRISDILAISPQRHGIRPYETVDLTLKYMHDVIWADTDLSHDPGKILQIVFRFLAVRNDDTCDVCIVKRRRFM